MIYWTAVMVEGEMALNMCITIRIVCLGIMIGFISFSAGQHLQAQNYQRSIDSVQDLQIQTAQQALARLQDRHEQVIDRLQAVERDIATARGAGMALGGILALLEAVSLALHFRLKTALHH